MTENVYFQNHYAQNILTTKHIGVSTSKQPLYTHTSLYVNAITRGGWQNACRILMKPSSTVISAVQSLLNVGVLIRNLCFAWHFEEMDEVR